MNNRTGKRIARVMVSDKVTRDKAISEIMSGGVDAIEAAKLYEIALNQRVSRSVAQKIRHANTKGRTYRAQGFINERLKHTLLLISDLAEAGDLLGDDAAKAYRTLVLPLERRALIKPIGIDRLAGYVCTPLGRQLIDDGMYLFDYAH